MVRLFEPALCVVNVQGRSQFNPSLLRPMKNSTASEKLAANDGEASQLLFVAWLGLAMTLIFGLIYFFSAPFEYESDDSASRPYVSFVCLLVAATALSIFAIRIGLRIVHRQKSLLALIVLMAIGFRVVMAFTPPVLELDFYRYLWDGKVSAAGFSPFAYSPDQIKSVDLIRAGGDSTAGPLRSLAEIAAQSEANHAIINRIHYADHTTIYPPVSQLVFRLSAMLTPPQTSVQFHILVLRILLIGFDLGTILVLALLFKTLERNYAWLIAYAWNPLVIKEISNSAHLDSIAIFFVVLSVWFVIRARRNKPTPSAIAGGIALALGVGAKLFPVVIAPALFFALFKAGWQKGVYFAIAFGVTTLVVLSPMLLRSQVAETESEKTKDGLTSFLSTWRMNDVIFSSVYHNLKPYTGRGNSYWYAVTPNSFRQKVVDMTGTRLGNDPAFRLARIITLVLFAVIYLCFVKRFLVADDHHVLSGLLYLLFAFLMLQPTVNPWYWVWAIPFTCFISRWGWVAVSAVLSIYYLRYWFRELNFEFAFLGHSYKDEAIFHHFVAWGEFIAIVILILASSKFVSASQAKKVI